MIPELWKRLQLWHLRRAIREKDRQILRLRRRLIEHLAKLQRLNPRGRL